MKHGKDCFTQRASSLLETALHAATFDMPLEFTCETLLAQSRDLFRNTRLFATGNNTTNALNACQDLFLCYTSSMRALSQFRWRESISDARACDRFFHSTLLATENPERDSQLSLYSRDTLRLAQELGDSDVVNTLLQRPPAPGDTCATLYILAGVLDVPDVQMRPLPATISVKISHCKIRSPLPLYAAWQTQFCAPIEAEFAKVFESTDLFVKECVGWPPGDIVRKAINRWHLYLELDRHDEKKFAEYSMFCDARLRGVLLTLKLVVYLTLLNYQNITDDDRKSPAYAALCSGTIRAARRVLTTWTVLVYERLYRTLLRMVPADEEDFDLKCEVQSIVHTMSKQHTIDKALLEDFMLGYTENLHTSILNRSLRACIGVALDATHQSLRIVNSFSAMISTVLLAPSTQNLRDFTATCNLLHDTVGQQLMLQNIVLCKLCMMHSKVESKE